MELSRAWLSVMRTAVCAEPEAEYAYCLGSCLSWQCHMSSLLSPRWSIWQTSKRTWYQVFQPPVSLMCRRFVFYCIPPESTCSKRIMCPPQVLGGAPMLVCCNGPPVQPRRQVSYLLPAGAKTHAYIKSKYVETMCLQICLPPWWKSIQRQLETTARSQGLDETKKHVFILRGPYCFFGLIRFQLLKDFLLADEMRPSCITEPQIERPHPTVVQHAAVLGEVCRSRAQLLRAL